jgi:hypothetical protein
LAVGGLIAIAMVFLSCFAPREMPRPVTVTGRLVLVPVARPRMPDTVMMKCLAGIAAFCAA